MANNYYHPGVIMDHIPMAALVSGEPVVVGSLLGVALADIPVGEEGSVQVEYCFYLPKASSTVLDQGEEVWLNSAGNMSTTPVEGVRASIAFLPAVAGETQVLVKLNG